ncbi:MAG: hypothetical protein ABW252_05545 [Polyangiales bacterium]
MRAISLAPFAPLALGLIAACSLVYSDELSQKQCTEQADCDSYAAQLGTPLVCRSNACQAPFCNAQSDCPSGSACTQNLCVSSRSDGGAPSVTTCSADSDCASGSRCGFDKVCYAKWGCLDTTAEWASIKSNPTLEFTANHISDVAGSGTSLLPDLVADACGISNLSCSPPFVSSQNTRVSAAKLVTVPFSGIPARGFIGFVRLSARAGIDGGVAMPSDGGSSSQLLPNYVHFTTETPLVDDYPVQHRLLMIDSATFDLFSRSTGIPLDQTKGSVGLQVYDCGGRAAADVTLLANGFAEAYFTPVQGESLPIIGRDTTDENGAGIMINLRTDTFQAFTLRDVVQNRLITDQLNFYVKGGAINYVMYYPRQSALKKWTDQAKTVQ